MICIIFSSLCLSTFAFCCPSDSLCLSRIHHVLFWAPGAFPCSCNTITLGQTPVGCCCACTFPPNLNQHKHLWNPVDIFQSQLLGLSLTLQMKMHGCCDSDVLLCCCLPGEPSYLHLGFNISWGFSIMAIWESFLLATGITESPEKLNDWRLQVFLKITFID